MIDGEPPAGATPESAIKPTTAASETTAKVEEGHVDKSPFEGISLPEGIEVTKASVPVEVVQKPVEEIGGPLKRAGWREVASSKKAVPVSRAVQDTTPTPPFISPVNK